MYTAMVNYPTEANFMKHLPAYPVKEVEHTSKYLDFTSLTLSIIPMYGTKTVLCFLNEDV